jgi:hypothetical protein
MLCLVRFYALAIAYAANELRLLRRGGGASLRSTPHEHFQRENALEQFTLETLHSA